jgi:hypothetical protein
MLRNPDGIEAQFLGVLSLFQHFTEDPALGAGFRLCPRTQQKQGKLHDGNGPPSGLRVRNCKGLGKVRSLLPFREQTSTTGILFNDSGFRRNGTYFSARMS